MCTRVAFPSVDPHRLVWWVKMIGRLPVTSHPLPHIYGPLASPPPKAAARQGGESLASRVAHQPYSPMGQAHGSHLKATLLHSVKRLPKDKPRVDLESTRGSPVVSVDSRGIYFSLSSAALAAARTVGLVSSSDFSSAGMAALAGPPISPSV